MSGSGLFTTTLEKAAGKKATGIEVPAEIIEALGGGKRPAVRATVNGAVCVGSNPAEGTSGI